MEWQAVIISLTCIAGRVMINVMAKVRQGRAIGRAGSGSELAVFKTVIREGFMKNMTCEQSLKETRK